MGKIWDKINNTPMSLACSECGHKYTVLNKYTPTRWSTCPKCHPEILAELDDGQIHCPDCGSIQISANKKGFSLFTGLFGSQNVKITCLKCGKRWDAGDYN